jgi:two-component system NtrC family sensor kinase
VAEPTVLCVDDEAGIRNALRRVLRKEPYRLLTARSGPEGLALLDEEPVQVVISDQRMPSMVGIDFLKKVKRDWPDTVRVILSGYADLAAVVDSINQGEVYRFLTKPWNDEELKTTVRQCLQHYELLAENRRLNDRIRRQNRELRSRNIALGEAVTSTTAGLRLAQLVLEEMPVGILGLDDTGSVVLANQRAHDLLSRPAGGLLDLSLEECLPEAAAGLAGPAGTEVRSLPAAGGRLRFSASPFLHEDGARGTILVIREAGDGC